MSQVSHKQVLNLLLQGNTITEVAEMLDVSRTTIYNRRKDFLDYAEKEGILLAAEHFDVEDTFEELSNLALELKLNGLKVEEARRGSEILSLLDSFRVNSPEIFINEVMKKSEESNITGEEITKYALELKKLEQEEQKNYSQLISEINDRKTEHTKLENSLRIIKEQIEHVKDDLEHQIVESDTTKETLNIFIDTREHLRDNGISLEDTTRLEKLVSNFDEHDFDIEKIMDFFTSSRFLRDSFDRNKEDNERLEERNQALRKENSALEVKLENNLGMYSAIKGFEEAKISPEDVLEIIQIVTGMSQGLNISEEEAINQFVKDVKTQYTERNGYRFQIDELQKLQRLYQDKNTLLKEEVEVLEEVLDDRKEAIESLKRLDALDISNEEIVEWGELIKDLGYEVSTFRKMLSEIGGIPSYLEEKTQEVSALELKEKELRLNVNDLEKELAAIQDTLSLIRQSIEYETGKIKESVESFDNYFSSPDTGFKARSTRVVDDIVENLTTLINNTKYDWSNDLKKLDNNVKKILEETDRILENAYRGGRIVGQFHSLEPIHKILRDEQVSKTEGTIGVITMLTYIKIWLGKNYSEELDTFDKVIENLMRDLGDIY